VSGYHVSSISRPWDQEELALCCASWRISQPRRDQRKRDLTDQARKLTNLHCFRCPDALARPWPRKQPTRLAAPETLSRDSWLGQRNDHALEVKGFDSGMDGLVECIDAGEGLMSEVLRLQSVADGLDIVHIRPNGRWCQTRSRRCCRDAAPFARHLGASSA
jgi:hypothetical protein